jgi:hypothetical protein
MRPIGGVEDRSPLPWLIGRIAHLQKVFYVLIGLLYVAAFNGQWRIGLDSAIYRGLGASLAAGHGFRFGDWAGSVVYRGLPLVLAGVQLVAGNAAWPAVCIVLACGIGALFIIFKLIRLHEPAWVAICVTCGVGINSIYLQYCNELMTDVPFILGMLVALWGYDLLLKAIDGGDRRQTLRMVLLCGVGLIVAGSMRPTFWILAAGLGISVCVELIRRGHVFRAVALAAVMGITVLLLFINARIYLHTHVMSLMWQDTSEPLPVQLQAHHALGGYENEFIGHLEDDSNLIFARAGAMLYDDLPKSFFGVRMGYFGAGLSLIVLLLAIVGLGRRHLPWALITLLTVAVTLVWSTQARYYTAVLPFLLLGWLKGLLWIANRLPVSLRHWPIMLGLLLPTTTNLVMDARFIREQRAVSFLETYKEGKYVPLMHLSQVIAAKVPPGETVIGPSAPILSYLSGRHVYSERELLQHTSLRNLPRYIRAQRIDWAIFPARSYERERHIRQLMKFHILRRGPAWKGGMTDGMLLAPLRSVHVAGDWTKHFHIVQHPTTNPAVRRIKRRRHHATSRATSQPAAQGIGSEKAPDIPLNPSAPGTATRATGTNAAAPPALSNQAVLSWRPWLRAVKMAGTAPVQ